jgi:hypothetical protein
VVTATVLVLDQLAAYLGLITIRRSVGYMAPEKGRGRLKYHEIGRLMARIAVTGALTCGVAAAAVAGPAYAAGTTRYVGASAGSDTSCASPG